MFEYENEISFSQKIGKSLSNNYIEQFKEQSNLEQKAKDTFENHKSSVFLKCLGVFALITFIVPAFSVFLYLPSNIDIFKNIFAGFISGLSAFLLSSVIAHSVYTKIKKHTWFKNLGKYFKKSQSLKNEYLEQQQQILDLVKERNFQKELINHLNELIVIEKENYDNVYIEDSLNELILMFSESQNKEAKQAISDNMYYWETVAKIPAEQVHEEETISAFLQKLNVRLDNFPNLNNDNIKTKI